MAALTGVSPNAVKQTYETVKQQLPTVESIQGFLSAHQVGIAQLAIAYCSAVDDSAKRTQFWGVDPLAGGTTVAQVVDPLVDKVMGTNLQSQPDTTAVRSELTTRSRRSCAPARARIRS